MTAEQPATETVEAVEVPTMMEMNRRLAAAIDRCEPIRRDNVADTGKYTYNYSSLTDVLHVVKGALNAVGCTLSQPVYTHQGELCVGVTIIDKATGFELALPALTQPVKGDPQANGSAITYYRRYTLTSLFSLEVADDDGRAAHVADATPGERTPAEAETRRLIAGLEADLRRELISEFRDQFGVGLSDLPTNRHGDALGWTKRWLAGEPADGDVNAVAAANPEPNTEEYTNA